MKKRKIKLMEEKLMKKSQADEDYISRMRLLPSVKRITARHSKIGTKNKISKQRNQENSNF